MLLTPLVLRADSVLDSISAQVQDVYEKTKDCVVCVKAIGSPQTPPLMGTGFFIDERGRLLTTASVAANTSNLWILWQGKEIPIQPLGVDVRANVGLFQVTETAGDARFPALKLGDSKALKAGSIVISVGSPFGKRPAPSFGVVDDFDLPRGPKHCVTKLIRADIPLNPGEGGSPLLNSRGEVVGLLVASVEHSRTSYALPSHALRRLMADFERHGRAIYGWMGILVRECKAEGGEAGTCIKVQQVLPGTPAARAGIQPNDKILKLGDVPVVSLGDMLENCFAARVGEKINVVVQRQAMFTNFLVEVVQRPAVVSGLRATPTSANR